VHENLDIRLVVRNVDWEQEPSSGFLTPTVLKDGCPSDERVVYGAVRDNFGQAVIRRIHISNKLHITYQKEICFDRRGSDSFDTNGTILGHATAFGEIVRLYYVGFRRSKRVKFEAYSGLAESNDNGKTFKFKQTILDKNSFDLINGSVPDIVACHWNDFNIDGNGNALVAIGNGWIEKENTTFPKYSSFLIEVENFQFKNLIAQVPQNPKIYRLGRPRFLEGQEMKYAVLTGGRVNGDYRSYFFDFNGTAFKENTNMEFPVKPMKDSLFGQQVSYPELVNFLDPRDSIFLFNGDNMGADGCYSVSSKGWWS